MLARRENREDCNLDLHCLDLFGRQLVFQIFEHLPYCILLSALKVERVYNQYLLHKRYVLKDILRLMRLHFLSCNASESGWVQTPSPSTKKRIVSCSMTQHSASGGALTSYP